MKYKRVLSAALLLMFLFTMSVFSASAAENDQTNVSVQNGGCYTLDATDAYLGAGKIADNMGAAILFEPKSETMMYSLNPDAKMYPSSLVKILTALIAVEKGNLEEVVTVEQAILDSVPYGAASADLVDGEQMLLSDLLYCMMVGSANDAAAVIAHHIAGNQVSFVETMNSYAKELGCTATQFKNVHGLHHEEQFTTARDMAKILNAAIKNEAFMTYFSAIKHTVPATNKTPEPRDLSSQNFLMNTEKMELYFDERVLGGRTGITEAGLRCLATLAQKDGMQLISVVMDSKSTEDEKGNTSIYGSFNETKQLLDAGFNGYTVVQTLYEGQVLKQLQVKNGTNDVMIGSAKMAYSVLPAGAKVSDLSYRYVDEAEKPEAPITIGQQMSYVQVWYGSLCVGQAELVAMNGVPAQETEETPVEQKPIPKKNDSAAVIILLIVVGALVLVAVIRYGIPLYRRLRRKRLQKKRENRKKE